MTAPRITIITPSFNQAPFLEQTIRSVLDQRYPNLQYGIVDGGSTDGSTQIIERYRHQLAFAIIEPDRGQTQAINKGLRRADGEIVAWLCSDDTLLPHALQRIADHFTRHPQSSWAAGACLLTTAAGQPIRPDAPTGNFSLAGVLLRDGRHPFSLPQPGVFWRRNLHDHLGLLREDLHYCMDFEFWLRLLSAGHSPDILPHQLATYRLHDSSKTCAAPQGFMREHLAIEAHYARLLPFTQRLGVWRRMSYTRRAYAIRTSPNPTHLFAQALRRPWWLLSQQIWHALLQKPAAA
jgi:glycosyltransferase involved in cell wall biosynthesis